MPHDRDALLEERRSLHRRLAVAALVAVSLVLINVIGWRCSPTFLLAIAPIGWLVQTIARLREVNRELAKRSLGSGDDRPTS